MKHTFIISPYSKDTVSFIQTKFLIVLFRAWAQIRSLKVFIKCFENRLLSKGFQNDAFVFIQLKSLDWTEDKQKQGARFIEA